MMKDVQQRFKKLKRKLTSIKENNVDYHEKYLKDENDKKVTNRTLKVLMTREGLIENFMKKELRNLERYQRSAINKYKQ